MLTMTRNLFQKQLRASEQLMAEYEPDEQMREIMIGVAMIEIQATSPDDPWFKRIQRAVDYLYSDCGIPAYKAIRAANSAYVRLDLVL